MKSKNFTNAYSTRDFRFLLLVFVCGVGVLLNPTLAQKSYATSSIGIVDLLLEDVHVYGKVTTENGDPLPGVNIQVDGSSQGATTDAAGKFDLQLPQGRYVLRMTFVGYETETQEITVNGENQILKITMKETGLSLNEIVAIGSRSSTSRSNG